MINSMIKDLLAHEDLSNHHRPISSHQFIPGRFSLFGGGKRKAARIPRRMYEVNYAAFRNSCPIGNLQFLMMPVAAAA
jgi:hypothetical protein